MFEEGKFKVSIPLYISWIFILFLLQLAAYTFFRIFIFEQHGSLGNGFQQFFSNAFFLGYQLDLQVSAYLLIIPFVLLIINFLLPKQNKLLYYTAYSAASIGITLSFIICICDLYYYDFYKNRISADVLVWLSTTKQSLLFLKNDFVLWPYLFAILGVIVLLLFLFKFLFKKTIRNPEPIRNIRTKLGWILLSSLLFLHALRGATYTRPIGIRDAFCTNNAFVNNLALNPALSFFFTMSFFKINYYSSEEALQQVSTVLHEKFVRKNKFLARFVERSDSAQVPKNVILIVMESLSANRMKYFGDTHSATPFLDSLSKQSLFFDHIYSCGTHTHNGLFGVLYGMPSLPGIHPFSNAKTSTLHYEGIASTLKKHNYTTSFYCTHNEEFDNLGFFLRFNGFENIYGEKDYPPSWHEHYLGISDEHLYAYALQKMDEKAKTKKPFFDCLMTVTSHLPGMMPLQTTYKNKFEDQDLNVICYADWALAKFIDSCKRKPWFSNTLFVIIGDHGIYMPDDYAAPLSLNHIPLFFYNSNLPPKISANYGSQTDVYASLMELLHLSYQNYSLRNNLFLSPNAKAYFIQDNQICCLDSTHYLVMNQYGQDFMYDIKNKNKNVLGENESKENELKKHVFSFLQFAQEKMDEAH